MHNNSIIFLFLVFRDTIVANKAAKPSFSPLYPPSFEYGLVLLATLIRGVGGITSTRS